MSRADDLRKAMSKAQDQFDRLIIEFGDESLIAACNAGVWYDRRPIRNWQVDCIRKELERRRKGTATPPTGCCPPLTVRVEWRT